MNQDELRQDFLAWSGGFPPDSDEQIQKYAEYARPYDWDEEEVTQSLTLWHHEELFKELRGREHE